MVEHEEVVILGGGLAGLSLARHLLLETDKRVRLLDRRAELPAPRQKVGESTVQVAGHYFAKVLDLESYLLHEHFMKYNLRFYFKSGGRDNARFEDYGHVSIRPFSNVASYQVNRNTLEEELLRRCRSSERMRVTLGVEDLDVEIVPGGRHRVRYRQQGESHELDCDWLVDASGRNRFLARRMGLLREMPFRHETFFWWVDGTVDIERLTDRSRREIRLKSERGALGHLPVFLATNHFCDEGLWFWVIPLQGKTSLGLVYDRSVVEHREICSAEKATRWVCERFPLLARDLPQREVLDFGAIRNFSHDCERTISRDRWAMTGEAGRFTDPLYSPGSDLIAIYNTLIVAAVQLDDPAAFEGTIETYEQIMKAVATAYVPSYGTSYDALGDQEAFALKYAWELSVYFVAYVFPFINELFGDRRFLLTFLRFFGRLGPMNHAIHGLLSEFFQWKKVHAHPPPGPIFFDLTGIGTLREAEKCFYRVGVSVDEARDLLNRQLGSFEELARFVAAHVVSVVLGDERVLHDRRFLEGIDLRSESWGLEALCARWRQEGPGSDLWSWSFDPGVMQPFRAGPRTGVDGGELARAAAR